jgi:hypothetical protein
MTLDQPSEVPQRGYQARHHDVNAASPGAAPVVGVEDERHAGCCSASQASVCCDPTEKRTCCTPSAAAGDCGCR